MKNKLGFFFTSPNREIDPPTRGTAEKTLTLVFRHPSGGQRRLSNVRRMNNLSMKAGTSPHRGVVYVSSNPRFVSAWAMPLPVHQKGYNGARDNLAQLFIVLNFEYVNVFIRRYINAKDRQYRRNPEPKRR
ncbi:MAG: hypothetical protein M3458_04260 [Acidobacteriota bacterium]|nr:hypothetical protein [Acidobacteriota bacterium]